MYWGCGFLVDLAGRRLVGAVGGSCVTAEGETSEGATAEGSEGVAAFN